MKEHLKNLKSSKVAKNIFWRFIETFGRQGISFIMFIFATGILSNYELGLFSYSLTIITVITFLPIPIPAWPALQFRAARFMFPPTK